MYQWLANFESHVYWSTLLGFCGLTWLYSAPVVTFLTLMSVMLVRFVLSNVYCQYS